jgi:hypothetical protein
LIAHNSSETVLLDLRTKLLLGATALSVFGYIGLIYGSCALTPQCHLRSCGRYICGVIYDLENAPPAR